MQKRHRRRGHSVPVVPPHAVLPKSGKSQHQQQEQHAKAMQHQQQHTQLSRDRQKKAAAEQGKHQAVKRRAPDGPEQQQQQQQRCSNKRTKTLPSGESAKLQQPQQVQLQAQQVREPPPAGHKQPSVRKGSVRQGSSAAPTTQPVLPSAQHKHSRRQQQPGSEAAPTNTSGPTAPAAITLETTTSASGAGDWPTAGSSGPAAVQTESAAATISSASIANGATHTAARKPWRPQQQTGISSNWLQLQQQLQQQEAARPKQHRRGRQRGPAAAACADHQGTELVKKRIASTGHNTASTAQLAMDCEMVGVGPGGERDSLARVSLVNAHGNVLYDSYVAQKEPVTDYRTWVSGVSPQHLQGAPELSEVQAAVGKLLEGRTLVGHGLAKDLRVLMLSHPRKHIRDTAKYPPFMFSKGGKRRPRALRHLALQELGVTIQEGEHSSVDDARAALYLYQKHAATWERALKTPQGLKQLPTANRPAAGSKKKRVESYSSRNIADDPLADL